jgi:hypothetical protein
VPVRLLPLKPATVKATAPVPVPADGGAMAIHPTLAVALHEHVGPVVTVILPCPPSPLKTAEVGATEKVHTGGGASCVTVKVCPPATIVPVRAAPELVATVNVTLPVPVPDEAPETTIHVSAALALHAQAAEVATVNVPEPPAAANV